MLVVGTISPIGPVETVQFGKLFLEVQQAGTKGRAKGIGDLQVLSGYIFANQDPNVQGG